VLLVVRPFITVVAGVGRMDRRRFFTSSAIGAALWVGIVTPHGHVLGQAFPVLQDKLDVAIPPRRRRVARPRHLRVVAPPARGLPGAPRDPTS